MSKITTMIISLLLSTQVFSQTTHTISLGGGIEDISNSYLTPYNMKGITFIDIMYEKEKQINNKWETIFDININASSLKLNYNFANKLEKGPGNIDISATLNKAYLLKLISQNRLSLYGGFSTSLLSNYQVITYKVIDSYSDYTYYNFFKLSASIDIITSVQLNFKKIQFKNTTSYSFFNAMLYPNYYDDTPTEKINNYLSFSSIEKRKYFCNKFKMNFPLYINNTFFNSFSITYLLYYENSSINDIIYRNLRHIVTFGIIFNFNKVNIWAHPSNNK